MSEDEAFMTRNWHLNGTFNNKKIECKKLNKFFCREFRLQKFAKNSYKCLMINITIRNFLRFLKWIIQYKKGRERKLKNLLSLIQYGGYWVKNLPETFLGQLFSNIRYKISFNLGAIFTWKPGYALYRELWIRCWNCC